MIKNSIFLALWIFILCDCNRKTNNASDVSQKINIDSCITNELVSTIKKYINNVDGHFIEKDNLYYSVYFLNDSIGDFFTIWTFVIFPDYIEYKNPDKKFNYLFFEIENRKVILISDEGMPKNILFSNCPSNIKVGKIERNKESNYAGYYDGSRFPQSYQYSIDNGKIMIMELDTLFVDFLGPDYRSFEELHK